MNGFGIGIVKFTILNPRPRTHGYLQPHTATARMEKFRRLYNRASLSSEEVSMLRGILRQMDWAIGNSQAGVEEQ